MHLQQDLHFEPVSAIFVVELTDRASRPLPSCPERAKEFIHELLLDRGLKYDTIKHRSGRIYQIHCLRYEEAEQCRIKLMNFFFVEYQVHEISQRVQGEG